MLCHLSETHGHPDIARCPLCVWYGSLRGLETHVRGHFKKGPVACLVCDDKDMVPFDSYVLWYSHLEALHERDGLAGLKPPKETQKRIAGTKRKRSRCREMELKLDFEEPTATEPDQKRARVPAAHEAQVCEDHQLDEAEYDFMDDGDDESLSWSSCESVSVSGSNTPPGLETPHTGHRRSLSSPSAGTSASTSIMTWRTCC